MFTDTCIYVFNISCEYFSYNLLEVSKQGVCTYVIRVWFVSSCIPKVWRSVISNKIVAALQLHVTAIYSCTYRVRTATVSAHNVDSRTDNSLCTCICVHSMYIYICLYMYIHVVELAQFITVGN